MSEVFNLSPANISLFLECPRCFYMEIHHKIQRPKCFFPSLPGGMDRVIKGYYDTYRTQEKLPPEIKNIVSGKLLKDDTLLKQWRNNFQGLQHFNKDLNINIKGVLDDCIVDKNVFVPLDYKTRGYELKKETSDLYKNQLGIYSYLLSKNGYKVKNFAYLVFYYPKEVKENGLVSFNVEPLKIFIDIDFVDITISEATKNLSGPVPLPSPDCKFCSWVTNQHFLNKIA